MKPKPGRLQKCFRIPKRRLKGVADIQELPKNEKMGMRGEAGCGVRELDSLPPTPHFG
jgi:hypothetical protein